jgi:hypothetical protein
MLHCSAFRQGAAQESYANGSNAATILPKQLLRPLHRTAQKRLHGPADNVIDAASGFTQ